MKPSMNRAESQNYLVDDVAPLDVVTPANERELSQIVASANEDGIGIIPYGGGTRMSLGNPPARACLIVDITKLNRVVAHNYADLTASFQAGATMGFVSEVLAQQGQLLAIDPPIPDRATIGGTLAAAVNGPLKWHFGHPRDTVIGMKVIQPNGAVTKSGGQVVKNVSGYDMSRLHIGGLGSLGVILEASFKLTPIPMYEKTILASFESIDAAMNAAMNVFNSYVMPLAMVAFAPSVAARIGIEGNKANRYHLAIRLGGRTRTLDRQQDEISATFGREGASSTSTVSGQVISGDSLDLWRSLSDFGWSPRAAPLLNIRISALPSRVRDILDMIYQLRDSDLELATLAEPGFGTVEANWFGSGDAPYAALADIIANIRKRASALGGTAIVQRCPPRAKSGIDVWGDDHIGIDVMRRMKSRYDPNGIMNPGRFVGRI